MIDLITIRARDADDYAARLASVERERDEIMAMADKREGELRSRLAEWESAAQNGHPSPCTLGPLCPYCEIDRVKARLAEAERKIADALKTAGGRWCEWGSRAESVRDILDGAADSASGGA